MHGDVFVFVGQAVHLKSIAAHMAKNFTTKVAVTGPGSADTLRVLDCSIEWSHAGIIFQSDHRHADRLVGEL